MNRFRKFVRYQRMALRLHRLAFRELVMGSKAPLPMLQGPALERELERQLAVHIENGTLPLYVALELRRSSDRAMDANDEIRYLRDRVADLDRRIGAANDASEEPFARCTLTAIDVAQAVATLLVSANEIARVWGHPVWRKYDLACRNGWWWMLAWNLGIASLCSAAARGLELTP